MTKVASSFYSAAVPHRDIDGLYHATFGIPGDQPQWVNGQDGKRDVFRSHDAAVLAGFRVLVAKLNRARQEQTFQVKGHVHPRTRSWTAPVDTREPTIEQVFGSKK
ncbi:MULTISPECIES: hypothetical protein [unclassified Bradyrhizobium]|uniref:hypothetical protein n=1 Tax=unclassified Bradyrhizobium TaxID=2631580 RepID=UPI0028E1AA01|nr:MULTISPECIES: hypothetical protein [unclassified Bradyrhizobium]